MPSAFEIESLARLFNDHEKIRQGLLNPHWLSKISLISLARRTAKANMEDVPIESNELLQWADQVERFPGSKNFRAREILASILLSRVLGYIGKKKSSLRE